VDPISLERMILFGAVTMVVPIDATNMKINAAKSTLKRGPAEAMKMRFNGVAEKKLPFSEGIYWRF